MSDERTDVARGLASVREGAAPVFPKRFYAAAAVAPVAGGFALRLDGRPARTPGRNPLVLPTVELAEAVAAEWNAVTAVIDPRRMPMTRLVNTVIDGVSRMPEAVLDEVARFAASDLVVYRAGEPVDLVRAQNAAWDGLIAWSRDALNAPLTLGEGVMFVPQPPDTLARIAAELRNMVGTGAEAAFRIGALHVMTTLTGSALIAMAVAGRRLTAEKGWAAAHVDEDYQISLWGEDWEAAQRRAARWEDMRAAALVYRLAG